MARNKRKSSQPKLRKSSARLELEHEISLLQRRARDWSKKYHYVVDIPTASDFKRATRSAIESIRNIRISKLTEKQKRQYEANYINKYDAGEIPIPGSDVQYTPPSESQYLETGGVTDNTLSTGIDFVSDDGYYYDDTPVDSRQEIDSYLERVRDEILYVDGDKGNPVARDMLDNILWEARHNMGEDAYYHMMEDRTFVSQLQECAHVALSVSPKANGELKSDASDAILKFATLIHGRPLEGWQQQNLLNGQRADIALYDEDE